MKVKLYRKRLLCASIFCLSGLAAQPALAGLDQGDAYCVGADLQVDLEVTINNNLYRVNGTGPNLPSGEIAYPGSFTFNIPGAGDWSNLILEYSSDAGLSWDTSYRPVVPTAISCAEAAPPAPPEPPEVVPTLGTPALGMLALGLLVTARRGLRLAAGRRRGRA